MSISEFLERNYRHFNARETLAAAQAYREHLAAGGKMLVSLAGAMSTAEIGISLAPLIRSGKVHAISCTAANLEEDLYNLIANRDYRMVPDYRDLGPADELALRNEGFNRVTDTCIPEDVIRDVEGILLKYWQEADTAGESYFPHEYLFRLLREGQLESQYQVPSEDSWLVAAEQMNIPVYVPGFEDSTTGNIFAARVLDGSVSRHSVVRSGTDQMQQLVQWYREQSSDGTGIGFFQVGGGIAGDFAICAVPLILQDLQQEVPLWSYFAQITDSVTSYGSYSGAVPNEKITWYKLDVDCPKFTINSDASIVAPLVFAYVMGL